MNFFPYNLNTAYAKYLKALQGRKMARTTTGYAAMHAHKHARKHTHTHLVNRLAFYQNMNTLALSFIFSCQELLMSDYAM